MFVCKTTLCIGWIVFLVTKKEIATNPVLVSYAIMNKMKRHCIIFWNVQNMRPTDKISFSGLRPTMDKLNIDINNTQSVTNLITRGHTALSVFDNFALFYTVQEYIRKTIMFYVNSYQHNTNCTIINFILVCT